MANDQKRKLQCEIDLMKRVQKEIDALPGITFEEAFEATDVIGKCPFKAELIFGYDQGKKIKMADPHIKSRVKTLKGNFSAMHDMTHPKAAGMRDKPFIYYHKLSTIFGKDRTTGSRAEDLGEEEVVSDTEETTPTNCEDIDVNMVTSDTLNNSINAIGKEININLSKMANDQERKLQCEIDLMKRVQKEIDALPGITFEEDFEATMDIGKSAHSKYETSFRLIKEKRSRWYKWLQENPHK
ncbi:hypothetical protein Tco_0040366 [Tanacetum coccineum]